MEKIKEIAVLLTCHNRREGTLSCLSSLFDAKLPEGYQFEVFLVDDGSTDGTGDAVRENFPSVNVIQGNGNLYWNQGMRLAWDAALKSGYYDFFLWLNDDTILDETAVAELITCYDKSIAVDHKPAIIVGACKSSDSSSDFSYGGSWDSGPVIPNGELQKCKYINGNAVLVPKEIFDELGNLSNDYTHGMGDYDYGLRAINAGFICYTTLGYIAVCSENNDIPGWYSPEVPLSKRWNLLHSPNGLNLKEYNIFRRKFWAWKWIIYMMKAYLKVLFPRIYMKISNK